MERLTGIGVSPGVAVGPALVAIQRTQVIRFPIGPDRVARELSALERARVRSREQLEQIRRQLLERKGTELAAIFDAQVLMLDDPMLVWRAATIVCDERVNAEWAVQRALDEIAAVFNDVDDPYLRERKGDLHDVAGRLRMNLRDEKGGARDLLQDLDTPCVLIADELTPSVVAQLDWTRIRGFATDAGSRTYHTAIVARSLGVPAVVGLHDASLRVPAGAWVIIDGDTGAVVINPAEAERREAEAKMRHQRRRSVPAAAPEGPAVTADGVRIALGANIERLEEYQQVLTDSLGPRFTIELNPPYNNSVLRPMRDQAEAINRHDIDDSRSISRAAPETNWSGSSPIPIRRYVDTRLRPNTRTASSHAGGNAR